MPRYLPAEQITCPIMTTTVVPIVNSKTGVQVTSMQWPEALTANGQLYTTSASFITALQTTLVGNVTAAMSADGKSVTLVHDQFFTPPANVGIWPRVSVRILNEGGQNQCPFVGPVTGPQGGSFGSRASLIRAIDANDATAYYLEGSGSDCPVIVIYKPERAAPTDIIVTGAGTTSTIKLVEQSTGLPIECPPKFPIFLVSDGSEHNTLTTLATKIAASLPAGYTNVVPAADGCSITVRHSAALAAPANVQVNASKSVLIPVKLNGTAVCPPPWPVRLATDASGALYSTMAALAAAYQATLPNSRWRVTATNTCQVTVIYPAVQDAPTAVNIVSTSQLAGSFASARSSTSNGSADFSATMPPDDTHHGAYLLDATKVWPQAAQSVDLVTRLNQDMTLSHEGNLEGVPDGYDWAHNPKHGGGWNNAGGMQAAVVWGQVYPSFTPVTAQVQVRNMHIAQLVNGVWHVLATTKPDGSFNIDGEYYAADFVGNASSGGTSHLGDGTLIGTPLSGDNMHFYNSPRTLLAGGSGHMAMWYEARLAPGSDSRAKYLAGCGGDYWQTLDSPYPSNNDIAIGRHRYLKVGDWITVTAHTMNLAELTANPPPITLADAPVLAGNPEAATAWLYDLRQSNGAVPTGTVYKVKATLNPTGQVYVGLKNGPSSTAFLVPTSRGGGVPATAPGYTAAVTDLSTAATIEWAIPADVLAANLCLMVQAPAANRRVILSDISFETTAAPGGGGGGGGGTGTAPVISTIGSQTTGVGTALTVNFTVTNNPTSVTASAGTVTSLGSGNYKLVYTPTAAGTVTVTLTAVNASGTGTRAISVVVSSGNTPPPGGTAQTLKQQLKDDKSLPHEGALDGVPSFYDWAAGPRVGAGNNPASSGYNAATAWGEIYSSYGGTNNPAPNTLVQVANLRLAILSRATGQWTIVQACKSEGGTGLDAGYFQADFQGNVQSPNDPITLSDGTRAGAPNIKFNMHFFPQGRVGINNNDIAGICAWFDARLILANANGTDDRDAARMLAGAGGDYWATLTSGWPSNSDFAIGRHRWVRKEWQTYTAHTLTDAQIDANPPPIATFKTLSTGGGGGGTVTPPSTTGWKTPTGRAIRLMPVGDSITAMQGESSAGFTTLPGKITGRQLVTVGSQSGYNGAAHEGHGAWCADDASGRCTHTNGFHAGGIIQNIAGWLTTYTPDVVTLNIGTNDRFVQNGWNDTQIVTAIGRILDIAKATRPSCFILCTGLRYLSEVPGGYSDNAAFNTQLEALCTTRAAAGDAVGYFNAYSGFSSSADFDGGSDYVHPSDQGVAKMMTATAAALNALFTARA